MSEDDLDVLKEYWEFFKNNAPKIKSSDDKNIWVENKTNIKTAFDNLRKKIIMLDDNTELLKNMNEIETIYDSLNEQYPGVEKPKEAPEDTQDDDNIDKLGTKITNLYTEIGKLSNVSNEGGNESSLGFNKEWVSFGEKNQPIEEKVEEALIKEKDIYSKLTIGGKITYKENDNDNKEEATLITINYNDDDIKYIVYKDPNKTEEDGTLNMITTIEEVSVKNVTGVEIESESDLSDIMNKDNINEIFKKLHPAEAAEEATAEEAKLKEEEEAAKLKEAAAVQQQSNSSSSSPTAATEEAAKLKAEEAAKEAEEAAAPAEEAAALKEAELRAAAAVEE